jgi:hypothetical protein
MREPNDWRLMNQECFLKGATLIWQSYEPARVENDHDHCAFCLAKFMKADSPGVLREGYSTADRYRWVCKSCCDDFIDLFEWRIEPLM